MAGTRISVKIDVDLVHIKDRLESLLEDDTLRLAINNELARYCHPYVPYLHGPLSETVEVTPECVRYIQPYARRQYYGDDFNFTKDYHPLATSRWDEAMMRDRGEEFCNQVGKLIAWRSRELNG